jgi:hypothetical protein
MSTIPSNFTDGVFTITDDAGNSASLSCSNGDQALTGVTPNGRTVAPHESRGGLCGLRQTTRAFPQLTVSAILSAPASDFVKLATGLTAAFSSVASDIGDGVAVDFDMSFDYLAESRDYSGEDAVLTGLDYNEGDPSNISFTFTIYGPMDIDGEAVIPLR